MAQVDVKAGVVDDGTGLLVLTTPEVPPLEMLEATEAGLKTPIFVVVDSFPDIVDEEDALTPPPDDDCAVDEEVSFDLEEVDVEVLDEEEVETGAAEDDEIVVELNPADGILSKTFESEVMKWSLLRSPSIGLDNPRLAMI